MSKNQTPLLLITVVIFSFFVFGNIKAGSEHNVSGWAWSENIGWISFNNTSGGGATNYGVNIDSAGVFSGYAWSENIGWISFNRSDTGAPPTSPDYGTHLAEVNPSTGEVSGWARALSYGGGWSGWIKLRGSTYGVNINQTTGEFSGWAWSDGVVGWISFNCANPESGDICSTSDYKVITTTGTLNNPPSAMNLSMTEGYYCFSPYPPIFLSWEFSDPDSGDFQSAYRVQVDNNSDFSSPEDDSGKVLSGSWSYAPIGLSYNTTYYWQVMVWDSFGSSSDWTLGQPFTTPPHAYPEPDFGWTPPSPAVDELIEFTASTTYYGIVPTHFWDFDTAVDSSGDGIPDNDIDATGATTTHSYSQEGDYTVRLTACDGVGCCYIDKPLSGQLPFPEWKEIPPF